MTHNLLILEGDGIGPEIVAEAMKVVDCLQSDYGFQAEIEHGLIGGAGVDGAGDPLPEATLDQAKQADAILLGAVGGVKWDSLERPMRPEQGLLRIRAGLDLFANLRPAILYPELVDASTLKPDVVSGLDIMIVRELTGGIYFGQPRGIRELENGEKEGFNTLVYRESEVDRITRVAVDVAKKRSSTLCSVDKANVLEVSELWRNKVTEICDEVGGINLSHMYVDNAAMQLIREPKQFDVIVTGNMFGDILSDAAAMLTGSIGMLPSASLNSDNKGMYEPIHGSAPDIAGKGIANPLATILSVAMMLRYSLNEGELADKIETSVRQVLADGARTADLGGSMTTSEMGNAVITVLKSN
ncbi:MAG: 3-isopropylmalate dehydrogenase [Gammaproteobacteria bacterium]|nr:3-isopropylmalate dehydrogenase [Gammaproteobacteria bacterium]